MDVKKLLGIVADTIAEQMRPILKRLDFLESLPAPEAVIGPPGPKGENGRDADAQAVARLIVEECSLQKSLIQNHEFIEQCKGEKGADADVHKIIECIKGDECFTGNIVQNLLSDAAFISNVKGEKGDRGEVGADGAPGPRGEDGRPGKDGPPGKGADNALIISELKECKELRQACKGDPGPQGEPGTDRVLVNASQYTFGAHYEKNQNVVFNGSLYQTIRKTTASPYDDPHSYHLLVAGIEGVSMSPDYETRQFVFSIKRADGECFPLLHPMAPQYIDALPKGAKIIAGDFKVDGNAFCVAKKNDPVTDDDFKRVEIQGPQGEPGKDGTRGRKGMQGNGIEHASLTGGVLKLTFTDAREPLEVDVKALIIQCLTELKVI